MIAPRLKLKPRPVVQPKYIDLAGSGAQIRRALLADQYPRLAQVLPALGDGEALLQFGYDDQQRPQVEASITFACALQCQLCLEPQQRQVKVDFVALLATDETQAQQWSEHLTRDMAVCVVGEELDVAALVEDEVLLQLPHNVCSDESCDNRPDLSYAPASGSHTALDEDHTETSNPFAVLEQLKQN